VQNNKKKKEEEKKRKQDKNERRERGRHGDPPAFARCARGPANVSQPRTPRASGSAARAASPPITAPCTHCLRHGDPLHAQERLTLRCAISGAGTVPSSPSSSSSLDSDELSSSAATCRTPDAQSARRRQLPPPARPHA
jgi:hypothetical protein